jgi:hypothetical protein
MVNCGAPPPNGCTPCEQAFYNAHEKGLVTLAQDVPGAGSATGDGGYSQSYDECFAPTAAGAAARIMSTLEAECGNDPKTGFVSMNGICQPNMGCTDPNCPGGCLW